MRVASRRAWRWRLGDILFSLPWMNNFNIIYRMLLFTKKYFFTL